MIVKTIEIETARGNIIELDVECIHEPAYRELRGDWGYEDMPDVYEIDSVYFNGRDMTDFVNKRRKLKNYITDKINEDE